MRVGFDTTDMTTPTTHEQALEVLHLLTAEHGTAAYFKKAEIVVSDGFHGVDVWVDRETWKEAKMATKIKPRINRVPICYMVVG